MGGKYRPTGAREAFAGGSVPANGYPRRLPTSPACGTRAVRLRACRMDALSASGEVMPSMRPTKVSETSLLASAMAVPSCTARTPVRLAE